MRREAASKKGASLVCMFLAYSRAYLECCLLQIKNALLFLYARSVWEKSWAVCVPSALEGHLRVAKCWRRVWWDPVTVRTGVSSAMMPGTVKNWRELEY